MEKTTALTGSIEGAPEHAGTWDLLRFWTMSGLVFLLVGIISTYILWMQGGIIGHNWDWSVNFNPDGTLALAKAATSAWWSVELGTPNVGVGNTPFWYAEAIFAHMPSVFSHLVVLLVPVLGALAGLALASQIQKYLGLRSRLSAWIGGLVFGFSPLYFNELQGGAITQVLAHSALAMALASLVRYRSDGSRRALFTAVLWTPLVALSLTDFALMYLVSLLFLGRPRFRAYVGFAVFALLLNLYWIVPFAYNVGTLLQSAGWSTAEPNLAVAVATPWQLFTLSGYFFSFYDSVRPIWFWVADLGTIVLIFAAFYAIHAARRTRPMLPFYTLFFVGTAAAAVAIGPLGPVLVWVYAHVPFVTALFRSPQHLMIVPTLGGTMVIATGVAALMQKVRSRKIAAAIALIALASRAPFLTGDLSTRYLSQLGPGRSMTTYVPSPGFAHALKIMERQTPSTQRFTRALFVPLAFSPLYKWTPYQAPGQGGDIAQLFLRHMSGSITYLPQVVTPDGASIEDALAQGLPGVLTTGLPSALDVSNIVVRYDIVANFEPFRDDAMIAYATAHTLDRHQGMWRRVLSQDFVDVYQEHAPPHVFLTRDLRIVAGNASDLADVEVPVTAPALALTGSTPVESYGSAKAYYNFETNSDIQIDAAAGAQILDGVTAERSFYIDQDGDYEIVLKREGAADLSSLRLRIDHFDLGTNLLQFEEIRAAQFAGANWVRYATIFLRHGHHVLRWLVPPVGLRALAIVPRGYLSPNTDYSYGDAPVIGIQAPQAGESLAKTFNLRTRRKLDVYAVVQQVRSNERDLPVATFAPHAPKAQTKLPFISANASESTFSMDIPPYWYVQSAQPRISPYTSLLPSTIPLQFDVSAPPGVSVEFHADVSAINRSRMVFMSSGSRTIQKDLYSELSHPIDALAVALGFARRPVGISLPVQRGEVDLSFSPAVSVYGAGSGLPIGALQSVWIDLHHDRVGAALPRSLHSAGSTSPVFGTTLPALPVRTLKSAVIYMKALGVEPTIEPRANAFIRCQGDLRSYIVPVQYLSGERGVTLRLELSGLQSFADTRQCTLAGIAAQLTAADSGIVPPYQVLGGDLYANDQWLLFGPRLALEPVSGVDGVYRIHSPASRFLRLQFPLGDPHFIATRGGHVLGKPYDIQHWTLQSVQLPGYQVFSAPLDVQVTRDLDGSEGRAAVEIGKRIILNKEYAIAGVDPFWYRDGQTLYVAWPSKLTGFGVGTLYVIPGSWFTAHHDYQTITLDLVPDFANAADGDVYIRLLAPHLLYPTAQSVYVSAVPASEVRVALDHSPMLLGLPGDADGGMVRTRLTRITLGPGRHVMRFSGAGDAACVILQRPTVRNQSIERPHIVSQSMYEWTIDVPARRKPMTVGLLESYNGAWSLGGIRSTLHFMLDGYANGWILPPGPPQRITIYYDGQTWLRAGASAAGLTLLVLVILIAVAARKERTAL